MGLENGHIIYLDFSRLPEGENHNHAITIAESLLHICGLDKGWDHPSFGNRLFYVRAFPQDIPQAGIYWIDATDKVVIKPN